MEAAMSLLRTGLSFGALNGIVYTPLKHSICENLDRSCRGGGVPWERMLTVSHCAKGCTVFSEDRKYVWNEQINPDWYVFLAQLKMTSRRGVFLTKISHVSKACNWLKVSLH